ncbi:MAG: glycosyltransferase family 2 protein [Clostridia bacterium]|nr:glycosyltransferase family 2 protein [Clostridia bacterium]
MTELSVIVPVYNGEKTIKNCIDSLLSQTLPDIEIIVVNDGSTDGTAEILSSYGDKITTVFQQNGGQGSARNKGISLSHGEYLGFADADDTCCKEMFEKMLKKAKETGAQVVQCGIRDIFGNGTQKERSCFSETVEISDRADYIFKYFYKLKHTNEVCNKLIKKSFLTENGLSFGDSKRYFSEDFKLNMDMLAYLSKISFVKECFYNYNISENGYCRADGSTLTRIPKIKAAFEDALSGPFDENSKKALTCVSALTLLSYCAKALKEKDENSSFVSDFLDDGFLKKCISVSMRYKSNIKHFCLYFLMRYAPKKVRMRLLLRHFLFEK